jgi:PAS domain S-box-containing protein
MEQSALKSQVGVPVIVLAHKQDNVEAINRLLRDAGHAVHCTGLSDINDVADALLQLPPELIVHFADEFPVAVPAVAELRRQSAPGIPLITVRDALDEAIISMDLEGGAQDVVSMTHSRRLQSVVARELRASRLERMLSETMDSARQYRQQLQEVVRNSVDAIAMVQEGIVVEVNLAWLDLFGYPADDGLLGQPLMDLFEVESHNVLKGALVASMQGRWDNRAIKVLAESCDGSSLPLALAFETTSFEGEPAVQVSVPRITEMLPATNAEAGIDPATGLYLRRHLLSAMEERLGKQLQGGVRALAWMRPDKLLELRNELGPMAVEPLLNGMAKLLQEQLGPTDLAGHLTGTAFGILLERGTMRDCEAWLDNVLQRIGVEVFEVGTRSLSITCSAGLAKSGRRAATLDLLLDEAERCCREARAGGGNRVRIPDNVADDTRAMEQDILWVRRIKAALVENRFRLVHQPIASLRDSHQGFYDILVRMVGEDGNDILPGDFMPAAHRNKLMKGVDRWIIGASMAFSIRNKPSLVFVRLSAETLCDPTLPTWLQNQLRTGGAQPQRLCFQVTEETCHLHLKETKGMAEALCRLGFQFAVEHFGIGRDPMQVLRHIPMNYVKIDGSLMQGLAGNETLQQKVGELITAAREHKVLTIAERVEDANTMAVLFKLGVCYMQGHYVHEPEVVLEDTALLRTIA